MTNQLRQDVIYSTGLFSQSGFEYPIEQEILLADYDRQIFKILKTTVTHSITSKYINGNKLVVEGFFRINVFYRPPGNGNLSVITKKLPFRKEIDIPGPPPRPFFVDVQGAVGYINTRAGGPTRVDIRGVYNFSVCCYRCKSESIATAVNSADVCCDSEETGHFYLWGTGSKNFSVEDDLNLSPQPGKILDIKAVINSRDLTAYKDKVNIKGDITLNIVYNRKDSGELTNAMKNFAYSRMTDVPGCAANCSRYAGVKVSGVTVTQSRENESPSCLVSLGADVMAFGKKSVIILKDAFSKKYIYTKETSPLQWDSNIQQINKNISLTVEDSVVSGCKPVYCVSDITPPAVWSAESGNVLKSRLTVSVIIKNGAGEYDCLTKSEDVYFAIPGINENNYYILDTVVTDVQSSVTDDKLKVKTSISVSGFEIIHSNMNVLSVFREDNRKPAESKNNGLVLYYREKGEKLFDIACRYKTDTDLIRQENGIEDRVLQDDRMLFIPDFGI